MGFSFSVRASEGFIEHLAGPLALDQTASGLALVNTAFLCSL
jgi:hypothetical protein